MIFNLILLYHILVVLIHEPRPAPRIFILEVVDFFLNLCRPLNARLSIPQIFIVSLVLVLRSVEHVNLPLD